MAISGQWGHIRSEDSQYPLVDPNAGTQLWFIPIGGVGIVLMILMGLSKLGAI